MPERACIGIHAIQNVGVHVCQLLIMLLLLNFAVLFGSRV